MDDKNTSLTDYILNTVPGGVATIVFDEELTIIYATEAFYELIKNVTAKSKSSKPRGLIQNVYSGDIIYLTHQLEAQKKRTDNKFQINFRMLQSNGMFRWIMVSGNLVEKEFQSGIKSYPLYSCIAMDVTDHMLQYKTIEQELDNYRTISELSKELIFKYEIAKDTLTFTELFREVFGKDAVIKEFSKKVENSKLIHEDEHPTVIKVFRGMMSGKKQARFELRLIPRDGIPVWYYCYTSIIFDENKNPSMLIGKLTTINQLRKEVEEAIPRKLDAVTNVLTKDCAEKLVGDYLLKQDKDTLSAVLLIEVRNYKGINDIYASLQEANILAKVAEIIKGCFRTSDVVGRISVNEFMVFMRDISGIQNAFIAAEMICNECDTLFPYKHNKNSLSVSIGISYAKGEKPEYQTLIANARSAMVMAKKDSSSSFEVFYN